MKFKFLAAAMFAAIMLLAMTACSNTQSKTTSDILDSISQQTEKQNHVEPSANEDFSANGGGDAKNESAPTGRNETSSINSDKASEDEAWKENFKNRLFEEYGVIPKYYEDLGNGIYQVYVEMGGKVVPFVTVDSATGDYHG